MLLVAPDGENHRVISRFHRLLDVWRGHLGQVDLLNQNDTDLKNCKETLKC
jgi:hypothetical protein